MERLIDEFDWAATPIGPKETWPQSLQTSLSICLASRFPILIWWGPEMIKLYNDAYAVILGGKHPAAIGAPGRNVWPEIWNIIGPMLDQVRREGKATWSNDQLLLVNRYGFTEECYFTFSYSPIRDESGGVGGIFTAVSETTARVVGERRLDTLRRLAERTSDAKSVEAACRDAAAILAGNPHDIPFAAIYLRRSNDRGERIEAVGAFPGEAPESFAWSDPPSFGSDRAMTLPMHVAGEEEPAGLLVAGISSHRPLDDEYRSFLTLVSGHIASSISNAKAYEFERRRAEELAELDRAKTAFFSNVSHEFRTPLSLILGPIEDVLAGGGVAGSDRDQLEAAHRNALRLLKLVNTLLDVSRIESGRIHATYEPTDLATLTTELAGAFRSAIERAGLRFVVNCPPLPEPVYVDRDMWEKIVFNLLSNALKFTFDGAIELSLSLAGTGVVLSVKDTGTGIPAEELPHVFERFQRVKGVRGRTFEGSGIGLSLVQELAKLHGGTVTATSEVDRGSEFVVTLPLGREHLPADRIGAPRTLQSTALRSDAYVVEALRWLPSVETPPPAPRPSTGVRHRVLLADDSADMRDYIGRLLGSRYELEAVGDGAAALEAARRHPPDLVLSDVMMPGMDGFELLRELRADERTRDVPVILLSARAGEESTIEGMEAGADDYLVKPFSAKELLARVEAHLKLRLLRLEAQAALRASEAKFSTAFDRSPLALTITAVDDGRLLEVNDGFVRLSGYTREEALGKTPEELGLWVDPEARTEGSRRLQAGEHIADFEARFRSKSGEELIGVLGAALVEIGGRACILSSVTDITARKHAEQAKDEFLATLSHELRTPLTSGYGYVKLLGKAHDPDLLQTGLHAIEESFVNQMKLIDDLLDVSRIAAGKMYVDVQPLDLGSVLDSAVEMVRPAATARGIELRLSSQTVLSVRGDVARLKQVFWNLLSNAIKFTSAGGTIEVALRQTGLNAEVVVRDDGEGIDPRFLPHVFDRFRQADSSMNRRHGGLGLGLAIVASLVEAHGGTVRAGSEGVGKGATFTVTLPLIAQQSVVAPASTAHAVRTDSSLDGARILVVDDDDGSRKLMISALESAGAEVRECDTASEAWDVVSEWRPDILVSDLAMPLEDGYSLIRRIRETGNPLPAVAITAYVRPEDAMRVQEAGFQRHVAKPFDPEELLLAVRALARRDAL